MKAKSSAYYQREYRRRLREQGLVKKEVWVLPENAKQLALLEKRLRLPGGVVESAGEVIMTEVIERWTTDSLFEALKNTELFEQGRASVEMIEGVDPALHVAMYEHGDLPVLLTVSGAQIIDEPIV